MFMCVCVSLFPQCVTIGPEVIVVTELRSEVVDEGEFSDSQKH